MPSRDTTPIREDTSNASRSVHPRLGKARVRMQPRLGNEEKRSRDTDNDAGTRERVPVNSSKRLRQAQALVAGLTPGLSLKNCLLMSEYCFHSAGSSSSTKMALTGQTGSQAP